MFMSNTPAIFKDTEQVFTPNIPPAVVSDSKPVFAPTTPSEFPDSQAIVAPNMQPLLADSKSVFAQNRQSIFADSTHGDEEAQDTDERYPSNTRTGDTRLQMLAPPPRDASINKFFRMKASEFRIQGHLGTGGGADVYKAEWTRSFSACSGTIIVALRKMHSNFGEIVRDREALSIWTDHPNVLKCFDATLDPPYLLASEYCAGGSLFDLLHCSDRAASVSQRIKILVDVAAGMRYLHEREPCILHRDLKSGNVLLTSKLLSSFQKPIAKVADFGLSRAADNANMMTREVGTWAWMAPEMFDMKPYDWRTDVFSFAILMYEAASLKLPYSDQPFGTDQRIVVLVCGGTRPALQGVCSDWPSEATELMKTNWARNPRERWSFKQILQYLMNLLTTLPALY